MQRARAKGLSPFTVYGRIARGWTAERALATPAPTRGTVIADHARAAGLRPDTVRHRIRRQGMTLAQATHEMRQ